MAEFIEIQLALIAIAKHFKALRVKLLVQNSLLQVGA
jgi:hypothetical protein